MATPKNIEAVFGPGFINLTTSEEGSVIRFQMIKHLAQDLRDGESVWRLKTHDGEEVAWMSRLSRLGFELIG
jgi:hypothetical protein